MIIHYYCDIIKKNHEKLEKQGKESFYGYLGIQNPLIITKLLTVVVRFELWVYSENIHKD